MRAVERPIAAIAEWNEEVAQVRAWVERERDDNRAVWLDDPEIKCSCCQQVQAELATKRSGKGYSRDPWRLVHGAAWCPGCYMERYDMRAR